MHYGLGEAGEGRELSTTMAFVRVLTLLLRHPQPGRLSGGWRKADTGRGSLLIVRGPVL